jgi:sensor histidine kinase regulating citrate/malate metabolism
MLAAIVDDTPAIRDSRVADRLVMAVLLLLILVAIVLLTVAILVSNVADVAALAKAPPAIKELIEVIAAELTAIAEALAVIEVDRVLICVAFICV